MRSSLRPDLQVIERFGLLKNLIQNEEQQVIKTFEYNEIINDQMRIYYECSQAKFFKRIQLRGQIYDTGEYSQRKKAKNCYICHNDIFYLINKIFEVDDTSYFMCRVLNWNSISINMVQITGQGGWRKIVSSDLIEKLVPCFCNSKLFLSKRPNFYFNE